MAGNHSNHINWVPFMLTTQTKKNVFELKIVGFKKYHFSNSPIFNVPFCKKLLDLANENLINWHKGHECGLTYMVCQAVLKKFIS